jgi:hypothetical protein
MGYLSKLSIAHTKFFKKIKSIGYVMRLSKTLLGNCLALLFLLSCSTENTPVYTLTTSANPAEAGSVTPAQGEYDEGEEVEIIASPNEHWVFNGWQGDQIGLQNPASITMDQNKLVSANFVKKKYPLHVTIDGEGVVNEKKLVDKSNDYEHGSKVELTAVPSEDWEFIQWKGDISGSGNPTIVNIEDGSTNVIAQFIQPNCEIELDISLKEYVLDAHWTGVVYEKSLKDFESYLRVKCNELKLNYVEGVYDLNQLDQYASFALRKPVFEPRSVIQENEFKVEKVHAYERRGDVKFSLTGFSDHYDVGEVYLNVLVKLTDNVTHSHVVQLTFIKKKDDEPSRSIKIKAGANTFVKTESGSFIPESIRVELERENLYSEAKWSIGDRYETTNGSPEDPDVFILYPSDLLTFSNNKGTLYVQINEDDPDKVRVYSDRKAFAILGDE